MKGLLTLIATCFAFTAWSGVSYPTIHYKYISDWDYREEVEQSDKFVVMVFSHNSCLERTIIDQTCFLFERKLDYFVPGFSSLVKVVGFNTNFENYHVISQFNVVKVPSVIIIKNNKIIKRMEPSFTQPDITMGRLGWQDELLKDVLNTVNRIR